MDLGRHVSTAVLCMTLGLGLLASPEIAGQAASEEPSRVPDLNGVWDFRTLTPLQRPERLGDKALYSREEAAAIGARAAARSARLDQPSRPDREPPPAGRSVGAYNNFWMDHSAGLVEDLRTSLIVDPPNGRLPPLVEGAERQVLGEGVPSHGFVRLRVRGLGTDDPEERGLSERCLQGFNAGPPITPRGYNQNVRIVQTPEYVVILSEMNHDARIVRIGGEHLPPEIRPWVGDSVGRWQDDTLVVDTTNFTHKIASFTPSDSVALGTGENLHLTERLSLVDDDTLRYEFTIEDPATFTRSFTAVLLMKRSPLKIYEYACHEGNYAMRNMLSIARYLEETGNDGDR